MKEIKWATPNRMEFKSLHKTFNKQVTCISTGNQLGGTVSSSYIRPYNKTKCNGFKYPPGQLQEYDLNCLVKEAPNSAKDWICRNGRDKTFILYVFFHRNGNGKKIIHGAIITDDHHNHMVTFYCRSGAKSKSILDEAKKYITNCEE